MNSITSASCIVKIAINFLFIYIFILNCLPVRIAKKIDNQLEKVTPLASARQVIIGLSLMYRLI